MRSTEETFHSTMQFKAERPVAVLRFRTNADKLPGVERVAIMLPDKQMLDYVYVPMKPLGPLGSGLVFFVFNAFLIKSGKLEAKTACRCSHRSVLGTSKDGDVARLFCPFWQPAMTWQFPWMICPQTSR